MKPKLPTQKRLREVLDYDPETGILTWIMRRRAVRVGAEAGRLNSHGYREVIVDRKFIGAHRAAWCWMTGEWPEIDIDHINRIRDDNRWCNLRLATRTQNLGNDGFRSLNTSGMKGVVWDRDRGKWRAQIKKGKITKNLGRFDDPQEAMDAYDAAAISYFGDYALTNAMLRK